VDTSLLRRTPVSSPVVLGDFEGNGRRWRCMSSLSRKFELGQFQASSTYSGSKIWPENEARRTRQDIHKIANQGCVRLGNSDLDFEIQISDFEIERVIRKRISPSRKPFSGWISIRKSKSGFHRFPFYRSIGKSEKGFAKLLSWTTVFFLLIVRVRARPLLLRTVFQIIFFGFPNRTVKTQIQKQISQRRNPFSHPHSLAPCLSHSRHTSLSLCGGEWPQAALELSVFISVFGRSWY